MAYESEVMHELEDEYSAEGEGEFEYEDESSLEGEGWLGAIGNIASSLLGESEAEDEYEDEYEDESAFESEYEYEAEDELNPMRKIYPDAMMEHLGELAAEAESEDEAAEHFLPLIGMAASKLLPVVARAVAPMARKALPKIARAVMKSAPRLTKGIGSIAKTLHRNPQTRHLLKTVPSIARRAVGTIAKRAAHGQRITPQYAVRTLGRQARRVLGNPQQRKLALRRHNRLENTFHRRFGRIARPHGNWRHGRYPYRYGRRPGYAVAGGQGAPAAGPQYRPGYRAPGARPQYVGGPGYRVPSGAPGPVYRAGAPGVAGGAVGYRPAAGGSSCTCPTCGAAPRQAAGAQPSTAAPAPAYCRCCGQVMR